MALESRVPWMVKTVETRYALIAETFFITAFSASSASLQFK